MPVAPAMRPGRWDPPAVLIPAHHQEGREGDPRVDQEGHLERGPSIDPPEREEGHVNLGPPRGHRRDRDRRARRSRERPRPRGPTCDRWGRWVGRPYPRSIRGRRPSATLCRRRASCRTAGGRRRRGAPSRARSSPCTPRRSCPRILRCMRSPARSSGVRRRDAERRKRDREAARSSRRECRPGSTRIPGLQQVHSNIAIVVTSLTSRS